MNDVTLLNADAMLFKDMQVYSAYSCLVSYSQFVSIKVCIQPLHRLVCVCAAYDTLDYQNGFDPSVRTGLEGIAYVQRSTVICDAFCEKRAHKSAL